MKKDSPQILKSPILILILLLISTSTFVYGVVNEELFIGSFYVNHLNVNQTASDHRTSRAIISLILKYDLMLVEGKIDEAAVKFYLGHLNKNPLNKYQYLFSGTYAFFYRSNKVKVLSNKKDTSGLFANPPFILNLQTLREKPYTFTSVALSFAADTTKTNSEIENLAQLFDTFGNTTNVLFMGNLNADCQFFTAQQKASNRFRNDTRFSWIIDDKVKTTLDQKCSYDRFIGTSDIKKRTVAASVKAYRYDFDFKLDLQQASNVSNHLPIQMKLFLSDKASAPFFVEVIVVVGFGSALALAVLALGVLACCINMKSKKGSGNGGTDYTKLSDKEQMP